MNALLLFLLFLSSAPVWGQSDPFFYYEWAVRPDELPRTTIAANAFDADAMACAVSATLRVHCWGDGPMVQRLDGVDAFALRKRVVAVTVGVNFGCAHFADLTAACWEPVEAAGSGLQYEVPQPQDPTRVSGEGHYLDLSAGLDFVVLSDLDVGLICLGLGCENFGNDLGVIQGDIDAGGHRAIQVSAGRQHVCVLSTSATVYCTGVASSVPSTKFKYVASGDDFACGISDTDAVECWGAGEAAVLLPPSVAFDQIQCDRNLADTTQHFCCGLRSNNVITCWGVGAPVIPGDVRASSIAVTSSGGALGELCYVDADTSESKCLNSGLTAYERDYKSPTIAGGVACGVRGDEPFCWTDFGVRSLGVNSGSLPDVALVRVSQSGVMCLASSSNDVECVAKTIFNERVTSLSIGRDSTVCGVSDTGGTGGEIICSDPTVATNLNTVANSTVASFVKSAQVRALLAVLVSKPDEVSCVPDCASQADYSTFGFPVTFSNNVAQVAGATKFFCARLITGDIQCVNQAAPTGQFSYLACGFSTCCAISQDAKTVTCWGTLAVLNDAVPTLSGTWSELSISPSAVCGTFTPSFATASDIVCWGTVASLDRTQRTALGVSAAPRRDILISPGANPLVSNSACGIHVFPDCPNLPAAFSMYQGMAFADYTIAAGTYSSTTTVTLAGHFARVTAATRVFPAAAVLGGTGQILLASDYIGMEVSYVSFSGYDANGAMFISASTAQQGGAFVRLDHVHFEDIISRTASGSALQINAEITLVVSNSHFVNTQSASGDGGAVALFSGGSYWFQTCNFTNTKAFLSGGAIFASSSGAGVLRIRDSTFTGGEATRSQGGCVFINEPYMDVEVSDTTMRVCTAPADQAGAIAATSFQSFASSDLSILSCSADRVGAMYLNTFSTDVTVELSDLLVSGCSATDTAGILVTSVHTLRLNTARFLNNKVTRPDGATQEQERGSSAGVQAETSALELIDCEFDGNSARSASSVHFNGDPNLAGGQTETPTFWFTATGCTVANNIADQNGAGFSLSGGDGYNLVGSISRCTFTNNTGEFASSVVATSVKSLNVTHSRFERNVAQAGGAMGLIFGHSARLDNVTFHGNRARYATEADRASLEADDIASGGALVLIPFFTSTPQDWVFTRCTFSDNSAEGSGGAVYWRTLNGQSLVNVFPPQSSSEITYSGNSALQGANVSSSETTATVDTVATQYSAKTGSAIRPVIVMRVFDAYGQAATALKQPCQARIENPLQDPLVAAIELDGTPSTSSAGVCTFSALTPRWDSRFFNSTVQMTVFIDDEFEGIDATVAATPISVRLEACDTGSIFVVEELTCLSCDPGKFANLTDPTEPRCELCDIGRFSSSSGARTCSPCGPGFVARSEGATECERCEAGSYSLPDRSECAECTPGRFQGSAGQTSCLACPRGSASDEDGATSCTLCPPGFAVFAEGATECNECGTGHFAKNPGSLNCTACPIGSAEDDEGASDCEVCAPGSFAAALASTECTECAAGTAQSNPGARNCEDCDYGTISDRTAQSECTACAAGKYTALTRQTECRACETSGLLCINGRSYVELNFWAYLDDDGDIRTTLCPEGICRSSTSRGAFIIDETGMLALESGESMNSLCGAGRLNYSENVLCGKCQEGFSEWNGECIECEEGGSGGIQFLFIVVAELFVIALIFVNRYRASGDVKIILYFVATARFLLGPEYYWLGWMGIFDFNPEAASAGDVCVMDLDPLEKMGFKLMMPLFFVFLLVVTCTLIWMCGGVCSCLRPRRDIAADSREDYGQDNARKADEGGFPTNVFIRSFLALLLFSYTSVSNIVLSFMHCVDVRGERVVFSVPAIDCDSDRYRRWSLLVYALFIFPVLGLPLITGYILRRAVRSGELVSTQRAMATKEKKFHARYSFLFESYRNGVYWWEVIALFRRSVLVAVRIALWDFPLERQQAIAITNLLLLMVHAMYQPFQFHHENSMETVSLAVLTTMSVIQTGIESFADYSDLQQVVLTLLTVVPFFGFGLYSLRTRCMAMCGKKVHRTVTAFGTDFARGAPEDEDAYSDSQDSESEVPGARRPQVEMQRVPVGNQPPAALPQQQRAQPAPIQQHNAPQQAQYAQSQPVHPAQVHPQQVQYAHSQPMGHQPSHSLSYSQPSASMMSESQSRQHMLSVSSQQQGEG